MSTKIQISHHEAPPQVSTGEKGSKKKRTSRNKSSSMHTRVNQVKAKMVKPKFRHRFRKWEKAPKSAEAARAVSTLAETKAANGTRSKIVRGVEPWSEMAQGLWYTSLRLICSSHKRRHVLTHSKVYRKGVLHIDSPLQQHSPAACATAVGDLAPRQFGHY